MTRMPQAIADFVRAAGVCRVATVLPDGTPHVSPVCPVSDDEHVYIDVSHVGGTAQALANGGPVTVLIDHYEDDWSKLRGVILQTNAREITGERKDAVWNMIREKFPQSRDAGWNPRLTLALEVVSWKPWGLDG